MPDKRHHRGPAPEDEHLFAPKVWPTLRTATSDLCWLLSRDYSPRSAVELVGNRYSLDKRQRMAIARCACSSTAWQRRQEHQVSTDQLKGRELWLDGYNVVTAIEAALAGGIILQGCDGCYRDMAGIYGRYRKVDETLPALRMVGAFASAITAGPCRWWLDSPVSNSGRFKQIILDLAAKMAWDWQVELVFSPDKVLSETSHVIASSDSVILDRCKSWINLARLIIDQSVKDVRLVDLCVYEL
jgi:hypothetical protein